MQSREWIRTDACSLAAQSKEPILLFSHQINRRHTPFLKTVMGLGTRIGGVVKIKQNHSKSRGFEPAHRNIEIPVNTRKFKVKKNQL